MKAADLIDDPFRRCACVRFSYQHQHSSRYCVDMDRLDMPEERRLLEHPDPWMDSHPGALTFPSSWAYLSP